NKVLEAIAEKDQVLPKNYASLGNEEKIRLLLNTEANISSEKYEGIIKDTIESVRTVKIIQEFNGPEGCNRYIISQCNSALNVIEVYGLFVLSGWKKENLPIDIVPLFETVEDLKNAGPIMESLYTNEDYMRHIRERKMKQTIMLGF